MSIISGKIRPLTAEERESAFEAARQRVAGPEVNPAMLASKVPSKYPWYTHVPVVVLIITILIAAFIPSAFHLYEAGSSSFCLVTPPDDPRCDIVGKMTILLAETGQLVFFFALAIIAESTLSRRIFWGGIALSTIIALAGNAHGREPWLHGNFLFHYLITFAPPVMVMATGYIIKEYLLMLVERRESLGQEVKKAEFARMERYNNPKSDPAWLRHYSFALREAIRQANSRHKAVMSEFTDEEWRYLVRMEMVAGDFVVVPEQMTLLDQVAEKQEEQRTEEIKALIAPTPISTPEYSVWASDDGDWFAKSNLSGFEPGQTFKSQAAAEKWAKDYNYRWNRRNKVAQ